jgi:hypothetical protein
MISPSITDTQVELLHGRAMVEVAEIEKENRLDILDGGARTELLKKGLYRFDANQPSVAVYEGKARVDDKDQGVEVGKGKQLSFDSPNSLLHPESFDHNQADNLYNWSKLRSEYLAQANAASVSTIVVNRPSWWAGTGWYWNPAFDTWSYVPGSGYLVSPFGFGFYSPQYWIYSPPVHYYPYPVYRYPRFGYVAPGHVYTGGANGFYGGRVQVARPALGGSGVRFGGIGHRR